MTHEQELLTHLKEIEYAARLLYEDLTETEGNNNPETGDEYNSSRELRVALENYDRWLESNGMKEDL